jgi:glycine/D-amino acid oxidase-like deaminating enzyme
MVSYWEKQSFTNYQYVVVGGGLVGFSTALSLKEFDPKASVLVLERGIFPTGASTRNAGFACFGSLTEILDDISVLGEAGALELISDRWLGLQKLRDRIGDNQLGYQNYGGYELLFSQDMSALNSLDKINSLLKPVFNKKVYSYRPELISTFGFDLARVKGLLKNPFEGQIHTGKMMKSLMNLAKTKGIDYLTGATVKKFERTTSGVVLDVSSFDPDAIQFMAKRVAICTNAFTNQLLPALDLQPGRGLVLITKPLKGLKFKGIFHYQKGYYYFRNVGSRVLFGGGRNIDIKGETTTDFGSNQTILEHLGQELAQVILPGLDFELDQEWSGIMAFGEDKRPMVGLYETNIGYAVRLGGMGVALGTLVGERLARLICLNDENS